MAIRPLIFWAILLQAALLQLGIKITCKSQSVSPIPLPSPVDTVDTLPGCETFDSFDCLVAKTAFGTPDYCKTYATTANCVIYFTPAFCGDVDQTVQNYTEAIQDCINQVPNGPCAYNDTARVCTSRLFSEFKFIDNYDPPRTSVADYVFSYIDVELHAINAIFGGSKDISWIIKEYEDLVWDLDQFMIGIFKNIWNSGINIARLFTVGGMWITRLECWTLSKSSLSLFKTPSDAVSTACSVLLSLLNDANGALEKLELPMDNDFQKAGDVFATIVSIVIPVVDIAKAIGLTGKIAAAFNIEQAAGKVGHYLVAGERGAATVEIWAEGENGVARGMTKAEADILKEDLATQGFKDLEECVTGSIPKRMDGSFVFCASPEYLLGDTAAYLSDSPPIDAIADELGWIEDVQEEPVMMAPIAIPEAEAAAAQAAPIAEGLQAEYEVPAVVDDAFRPADEQYWEDIVAQTLAGENQELLDPAMHQGFFTYDAEFQTIFEESISEAGPSNPQNFQPTGPLEGFMDDPIPPEPPNVANLPTPLTLRLDGIKRPPTKLEMLPVPEAQRFASQTQTLIDEYTNLYLQGLPTNLGAAGEWLAMSAEEGSTPASLAQRFQQTYGLDPRWMETVNWNANGGVLPSSSMMSPMVQNLPTYEGISHFWYDTIDGFRVKVTHMFTGARSQTWMDLDGIGPAPSRGRGFMFLEPGLPIISMKPPGKSLAIVMTKNAKVIGPALQNRMTPGSLVYPPYPKVFFKVTGKIPYEYPVIKRGGEMVAILLEEIGVLN